jgi:hypothetical protein
MERDVRSKQAGDQSHGVEEKKKETNYDKGAMKEEEKRMLSPYLQVGSGIL